MKPAPKKSRPAKSTDGHRSSSDASTKDGRTELLARNRLAAQRCRQKKRQQEERLVERQRELEAEHTQMMYYAARLKEEVLSLKTEVLRHAGCESRVIDGYIADLARKSVPQKRDGHSGADSTVSPSPS